MHHHRLQFLAGFLLAALVDAPASTPAAAAEAYLCDQNRLVYVEVQDLERMIRTDPCIARYHGIDTGEATSPRDALVRFTEPLAAPTVAVAAAPAPAAAAIPPAAAAANAISPLRTTSRSSSARHKPAAAHARAEPAPVQAAPGTDFQNVRVINATEEAERWFRLAR